MRLIRITSTIIAFISIFTVCLSAQMPDWKGVKDKDGNRYFWDANGKVRTLGKPVYNYKPVSVEGIEYYSAHAEELIKCHYATEGLIILRSIIAMPVDDFRVYQAQQKASGLINKLIKEQGNRYENLLRNASLIMYQHHGEVVVLDEIMRFSVKIEGIVEVIKKREKVVTGYSRHGVILGIQFDRTIVENEGYDSLLAIDAEKYMIPVTSIAMIKDHWDVIVEYADITRSEIKKNENMILYDFSIKGKHKLNGFEGIYKTKNHGYFIKLIGSESKSKAFRERMKEVIDSFTVIEE